MKFCRQCGKTVAIFNDSDLELCSGCTPEKSGKSDRSALEKKCFEDLLTATVRISDGKILLESEGGVLLWSGAGDRSHPLESILDRGSRILAIRRKKR